MKTYELIEHTADIRIRVRGEDLKELFRNSAAAMFDIIAAKRSQRHNVPAAGGSAFGGTTSQVKKVTVKLEADTSEDLLVSWLNELLSLSATKDLIFSDFQINKLNNNSLQAKVTGESMANYKVNTEIKAATYHELKIEKVKAGLGAEVIFDV